MNGELLSILAAYLEAACMTCVSSLRAFSDDGECYLSLFPIFFPTLGQQTPRCFSREQGTICPTQVM